MRLIHIVTSVALLVVVLGCASTTTPAARSGRPVTTIKVGIMPIPDCATVPVAELKKYFEAEGLHVERVLVQGGGVALPKLKSGELQFAIMNYVAAIQNEVKKPGTIKIVTDAYQGAKNGFVVMVPKESPIQSVSDLRGKRIAVVTLRSVGTLTLEAALRVAGLTKDDVHISELPLPQMINRLETGLIDAAWMTEPFITSYATLRGGRMVADMMQGQTEDLAIAGWATSSAFAKDHPATVRAFQRAMLLAQTDVAQDRQLVTSILPTYTEIDEKTAATISIGTFPVDLAPSRIQKVADLMEEYDYIPSRLDVINAKLLAPLPAITTPSASTLPPSPSAGRSQQESAS